MARNLQEEAFDQVKSDLAKNETELNQLQKKIVSRLEQGKILYCKTKINHIWYIKIILGAGDDDPLLNEYRSMKAGLIEDKKRLTAEREKLLGLQGRLFNYRYIFDKTVL